MSDRTTNLDMPFIMPSQAQKHVTYNEALLVLDAIVQLSVIGESANPPETPEPGNRFVVATDATDAWSGRIGQIAIWQDGYWAFAKPGIGWRAWFETGGRLKVFNGSAWQDMPLPENAGVVTIGVSATADSTNRLSLSSPASLFNHAGDSHRLKINKASAIDTATLLFQSGWTGHAEMGLAGDTNFSIKVSEGSDWKAGLVIDGAGRVTMPNQPAARLYRSGTTFTPTSGQQSGMSDFALNRGGFTLGAAVAGGGNAIVIPATGLYLIALTLSMAAAAAAYGVTVSRNGSPGLLTLAGAAGNSTTLSSSAIAQLQQGDTLTFSHTGSATLNAGLTGTILSVAMI
ncbi:DUF2793 domain-containing protein [Rhizobium sp. ZW T2_16]|uniref:DUF2793 domain-containing protein n=1 Tax=Rhizobium sp. ZW T2_16 TaxID=3378083 RepID=UPI003854070D